MVVKSSSPRVVLEDIDIYECQFYESHFFLETLHDDVDVSLRVMER